MLKKISKTGSKASGHSFAIVASRYNGRYVDSMLKAAKNELTQAGAANVKVVRVPGSFEIPVVAAKLASQGACSAVICLGVVLRGATTHAQNIVESVSLTLAEIQARHHVPIIHEVLLLENEEQARQRCLDKDHNRGREAALTAIEMARVMKSL
jgi:6,7-dimethyl-8-ribityllumazine synthase